MTEAQEASARCGDTKCFQQFAQTCGKTDCRAFMAQFAHPRTINLQQLSCLLLLPHTPGTDFAPHTGCNVHKFVAPHGNEKMLYNEFVHGGTLYEVYTI